MCVKYAWLAPRFIFQLLRPKLMSDTSKNQNVTNLAERNTGRELIETNMIIVCEGGAGALKVLGHCKSRKCSKLSRFSLSIDRNQLQLD